MSEQIDKKVVDERLKIDFQMYKQVLAFLGADLPLGCLCLPSAIETILKNEGIDRVYDLMGRDLSEIKGLGKARIELLTSRLDEFFSISL